MRQTPFHEPLDRTVNGLPTGLKHQGGFPPGQPPRPAGQKDHHRGRHRSFTLAPGNMLNAHAVNGAFHPPRRVEKQHPNPPQRRERPVPLRQQVIARTNLQALSTFAPNPLVRFNPHLDPLRTPRAPQTNAAVNESNKALNSVQKRLNFQLSGWLVVFYHTRFYPESVNNGQPLFVSSRHGKPTVLVGELKLVEWWLLSLSSHHSTVKYNRLFRSFYPQFLLKSLI